MAPLMSFSAKKQAPVKAGKPRPALSKAAAVFGDDSDDDRPERRPRLPAPMAALSMEVEDVGGEAIDTFGDDLTAKPENATAADLKSNSKPASTAPAPPRRLKINHEQSLSAKRSAAQATAGVDDSLYDYDNFVGARNAVERERKAQVQETNHMDDLLAAAAQRKADQDRARDKLLQRQREAEGDAFKDKEAFVTAAYKESQAAAKAAEELERQREAKEDAKRKSGAGVLQFRRGVMDAGERQYEQVAARLEQGVAATDVAGAEAEQDAARQAQQAALAAARAAGRDVELTAEGEIADKRELLKGGLNVALKPRPKEAPGPAKAEASPAAATYTRPAGQSAARHAQRQRQTAMLEQQLAAAAKRERDEAEASAAELARAAKTSKTTGEISSARERYLARKAAAAAGGKEA